MGGNFKVRALKDYVNFFTNGEMYEFRNGRCMWDNGVNSCFYESFKQFIERNRMFWKDCFELITEEEGEDKMESTKANFKVKCLDTRGCNKSYTNGKIYEVVDGVFICDDGYNIMGIYSFDEFNNMTSAMWKLVEDSSDLRELIKPCYLLVLENDIKVKTVETQNGIVGQYQYGRWDELNTMINKVEKIYGFSTHGARIGEFSEEDRKLIYEKKSPTQLKLEELEKKQREIDDEMEKLRKEL